MATVNDDEIGEGRTPGRDLLEYLEIPLRYPRHMLIPLVAILALGVLANAVVARKYRSATLILVEPSRVPDYFVTPMATEGIDKRLQTIRQVILSRTRLENVVREVDPYPEAAHLPLSIVVEGMRRAINIRVQGSDSFSIEYVNKDPHKAMRVTNMLAEQFIEDSTYLREELTERTYAFIESNVEEARKELEVREGALRELKRKYWGSLPEQLDSNLRMLQQLQFEQQTVVTNLATLEERRAALERSLLEAQRLAERRASDDSDPRVEIAGLEAKLTELRSRYTEEHPDVRALRFRIEHLKTDGDARSGSERDPRLVTLETSLEKAERAIEALNARREQLDERIAEYQYRVERTPRAEQELLSVTRDYEQLQENYNVMRRKDLEARSARKMEEYWQGGYFRMLDPANVPERPIRRYGLLFIGGGLLLGIGAGLAAAVAADFLDHSIKSVRELEATLPFPLLADIPLAKPPRRRRGSLQASEA